MHSRRHTDIVVWPYNCAQCRSVMLELQQDLEGGLADFVLVQEPYCFLHEVRGLDRNYRVFLSAPADRRGPRAAIVCCRGRVKPMVIPSLVSTLGVCVNVRLWFGEIYLASVYSAGSGWMGDTLEYLDRVLVGMDANACHPYWHSKNVYHDRRVPRGVELASWIEDHRMVVLNTPSDRFTYLGGRGRSPSDIDVTLRTWHWHDQVQLEWAVLDRA